MSAREKFKNQTSNASKPLLSQSTILILSGFLIGMVSRQLVRPELEMYVYCAGVAGLFAYLALDFLARRRKQRAESLASEHATTQLESRVDKHIFEQSAVRKQKPKMTTAKSRSQYLTVANSDRLR